MSFKKTYRPAKGYTEICKIGECSLHRLSFGMIELDAGEQLPFETGFLADTARFVLNREY